MALSDSFSFTNYHIDLTLGNAQFFYELTHNGTVNQFCEVLTFKPPLSVSGDQRRLISLIGSDLHLLLGLSYWKTYCPGHIVVNQQHLTPEQATFWNTLYTKGLGEFFYKNGLDFRNLVRFPAAASTPRIPVSPEFGNRSLVLVGGGKDSAVSVELLKKTHQDFSLFTLNTSGIQDDMVKIADRDRILINRQLDKTLLTLNTTPDVYNGHLPITAIYSFCAVFAAALYGYKYVIASTEESANYGNVTYLDSEINHQWSKSYEFESLLRLYIQTQLTSSIEYFSLLRPFSEVVIAKEFSGYPQYFHKFSSCNRNFSLSHTQDVPSCWCGQCPKCAFVFLLMAAFLPKKTVVSMFGKNLLADEQLVSTYKQLLGLEAFKPFECVGTPQETQYLLLHIMARGEFADDRVMKLLDADLQTFLPATNQLTREVFTKNPNHHIPEVFTQVLSTV